jgi:hypothetical protein
MYVIKVIYKAGHDEYRFEAETWEDVLEEFRDYADFIGAETLEEVHEIEDAYGAEFEIIFHQAPLGKLTL